MQFFKNVLAWFRNPNSPSLMDLLKKLPNWRKSLQKIGLPKLAKIRSRFAWLQTVVNQLMGKKKPSRQAGSAEKPKTGWSRLVRFTLVGIFLYLVLNYFGLLEAPGKFIFLATFWALGIFLLFGTLVVFLAGRWLIHRNYRERNPEEKAEAAKLKRIGKNLQLGSAVLLGILVLAIGLIFLWKAGVFGWIWKNGLYILGAILGATCIYLLSKKKSGEEKGVKGADLAKVGSGAGKFLMVAIILGALFFGPLILGGMIAKRNIWSDISGTTAMWALIGLVIPVIAFAFMGKGAKFAAVIITLMIYSMVGQTIIQKGKDEMRERRRLAGPPPMTARDWRLKVDSEPQGSRHQNYRYYNVRVTHWDDQMISLKVSFVTEQGEPSEGFMFWDKRKNPTAGEWYQNYERRGGTWAWTQVGPNQYAGDMVDVRGVPYSIALEAVP